MDIKLILLNQLAIMQVLYVRGDHPDPVLEQQIKKTQERIKNWGQ